MVWSWYEIGMKLSNGMYIATDEAYKEEWYRKGTVIDYFKYIFCRLPVESIYRYVGIIW